MPTKKKSINEGLNAALHQEDVLKAVVIADSFDTRCFPVTAKRPRALFPLANKPLLIYTLELLTSCGVQHIYLYCCHCADQIKDYLQCNDWTNRNSCTVTPIVSDDLHSIGNVLRDVDQKSLFQSDFLLVPGDVVGNIQLKHAVEEHKVRRQKDKKAPLMTLVLSSANPPNRCRSAENDIFIMSDRTTKRVLHYEKITRGQKRAPYPTSIFRSKINVVELSYDILDTGIWVCSPQVPQLFTDNFDYQTRFDFIKGILINEEFLGNQIHMHVSRTRYCGRVHNLHTYDVVSRDVLARWTHPFVPDKEFVDVGINSEKGGECYRVHRNNVYLHTTCSRGTDVIIQDGSIIGKNASIGNGSLIFNSVIGNGSRIGDNCIIRDSYIWDNVVIENNSEVHGSLVCDKVVVHQSVLENGCVLCDQVVVGPSITLPPRTVVHLFGKDEDAFGDNELNKEGLYDTNVLGSNGKGYIWRSHDDDVSDVDTSLIDGFWGMSLNEHNQEIEKSHTDEDVATESEVSSFASFGDDASQVSLDLGDDDDDLSIFQREVLESLLGGFNEQVQCGNLVLEVNSSKYAYNMSTDDVLHTITKSIFEIASNIDPSNSQYFQTLKKVLNYFVPLLCNYTKTALSQVECLYAIEEYAATHEHAANCLVKMLMFLYEKDVLSEDAILHWNSKPKTSYLALLTPEEIRKKVEKFVQWLNEAEEEDSDE